MAVPAVGGKADTGLGERDDEDEDEEDDIGHSRGFMSWRLRQKAVTCSVLCTEGEKETQDVIFWLFRIFLKVDLREKMLHLMCLWYVKWYLSC